MACKRSMDCTCPQCAAASAEFSVDDLKQFSSTINYGDEVDDSNVPTSEVPVKPKPRAKPKPKPRPAAPAAVPKAPAMTGGADAPPPVPQLGAHSAVPQAGGVAIGDDEDGPLDSRLVSKDWKVRKAAYQQLQALFQQAEAGSNDVFRDYAPFLKGMVHDSNASCLDVALDAILVFAEAYSNSSEHAQELAPGVVAKGLSGRPGTITRAEDVLLKQMEVDTPNVVVGVLLEGLSEKKPKVPPACVGILIKALQMFGARAMPLKDLKAALPDMLGHKVVAVRQQGLALAAEIISWCGEPMLASTIADLRSAQKADLDQLVKAKATDSPRVPSLFLRRDRLSDTDQAEGRSSKTAEAVFDPREFAESVDILSKLPKTEFNQKVAATKWSEILEGLNIAIDLIGPLPKLTAGDYGDLVQKVKRLGDHSHVQVASASHRLLSLLAEGLGPAFQPYCRSILGAMLVKLKDKKCVSVLGTYLDNVYGNPHSLDQVVDETVAALDPKKAIHARVAALQWISRCVDRSKPSVEVATLTTLAKSTLRLVNDSDPKIREAGSTTMAAIANSSRGPRGPAPAVWAVVTELEIVNARAFKRIRDQVDEKAGAATAGPEKKPSSASSQGQTLERPTSATSGKPASGVQGSSGKSAGIKPAPTRARGAPRGPTKALPKPRAAPTSSSSGQRKPAASALEGNDDENDDTMSMTVEEAMDKLESVGIEGWGDIIVPGLQGAAWKAKVASIERVSEVVQSDPGSFLGPVILVLAANTKQFKDSNFFVLKAAFHGIKILLDATPEAGSAKRNNTAVSTVLSPAVEKLGDRKLQEIVAALLTSAAEALGPSWVTRRVMKTAGQAKAPLAHSEALVWIQSCVEDFGAGALPAAQIVAFAVAELEHTNPKVRSSALELLGSMFHRLGPPMKALLPELRAALQSQVDGIFDKVGYDPAANSQATRKAPPANGVQSDGGGSTVGGGLPRMDLSTLLEKDCTSRMQCVKGKEAWKGRKAAMEEVVQACTKSGNYLEANRFMVELLKTITPRLGDSQSNLKPLAAGALAEVASSVGPESAVKLTRIYAEPLLACVADNRKLMRDAAIAALEKVTTSGGTLHIATAEALMGPVVVAMANMVGRIELLSWLKPIIPLLSPGEGPVSLVLPLLMCMQDKSAGARQVAQDCLSALITAGTVQPSRVRAATRDFQPAVMRQLKPALEKVLESSGPSPVDPGATDVAGPPVTVQAAPPVVVSKLVRGRSAATSSTGLQAKRSSRSVTVDKAESILEGDSVPSAASSGPLLSTSSKAKRLESEKRTRWSVSSDEPRDHQTGLLKTLWAPLIRPDATDTLFPARVGSMECGTPGVELLSGALRDQPNAFMDQLDLTFKWVSLRLCEKENVKAMGQLLQFLGSTFDVLVATHYRLEDLEVDALLPTLIEKSGQAKERFRVAIRGLLSKVPLLCSYAKYSPMLLHATGSKNSRTRIACLLELSRCIEVDGPASVLGKKGLKELAKHVDSDQAEVRSAALDAVGSCYVALEMDSARIHRLLGPVNDKTKTLVDERLKAADRKNTSKIASGAGQTNQRAAREEARSPEGPIPDHRTAPPHLSVPTGGTTPLASFSAGVHEPIATPVHATEPGPEPERGSGHRASLEGLGCDSTWEGLPSGGRGSNCSDEEGPFRFECDDLEVKLSPRSREREASNIASDATFDNLVMELETGFLRGQSLLKLSSEDRAAAVEQVKSLSRWATAYAQRTGGQTIPVAHHSRLVKTLVRCMRLSFVGSAPVSAEDRQYADVAGAGGIDVELAAQVVTALDDVCILSPRSFDAPSLAALLGEVCRWLVEQRIGPRARHDEYKTCDPYAQVQHKLNRVATASGSADPPVAMAALLDVMSRVHAKNAGRKDHEQISGKGRRSLETKLLKVYVKLLARLLRDCEKDNFGADDQETDELKELGLPLVLRALHKYHTAEDAVDVTGFNSEERNAYEAAQRLVSLLCERICTAWGDRAVLSVADTIRRDDKETGNDGKARVDSWTALLRRCKVPLKEANGDTGRRHSSPVLPVKSDHVAEIARLIGLVSAESQSVYDGAGDGPTALSELKKYLQRWPEAQATLEDQVDRLKPRFRQFILERCKNTDDSDAGARRTPLRGRMADVYGSWSTRRGQELEGARKSLMFEADENALKPSTKSSSVAHEDDDAGLKKPNRLQEIRQRMIYLAGREHGGTAAGPSGAESATEDAFTSAALDAEERVDPRPQPLKQNNSCSTADLEQRLRRAQSKPAQVTTHNGDRAATSSSLAERMKRRNT